MTSGITCKCGYCGRPVIGMAQYANGIPYHLECTRGPSFHEPIYSAPSISEERIRQIVREEMAIKSAPYGAKP